MDEKMEKFLLLKRILNPLTVSQKSNKNEIIIKCPYCGDKNDEKHKITGHYHMYINVDNGLFHCFLCGAEGSLKKLIFDNKDKLNITAEDFVLLTKYYVFPSISRYPVINYNININAKVKMFISLLKINNELLDHLKDRISIKENDNDNFLYNIINKRIIIPSYHISDFLSFKFFNFNKFNYYIIPLFIYNGIQLYIPNHNPKYIIYTIDKQIPGCTIFGNMKNPKTIYIVEGIFDGLKLYNILDMDPNIMIFVLTGKSKVKSIISALKILNIYNIENIEYVFGLDSDVPMDEYIQLVNQFKNSFFSYNYNIFILKWNNTKYKDIGEIPSKEEFYNNTKKIEFKLIELKKIYDKIF